MAFHYQPARHTNSLAVSGYAQAPTNNFKPPRGIGELPRPPKHPSEHLDLGKPSQGFTYVPNYEAELERPPALTIATLPNGTKIGPYKEFLVDNQQWSVGIREYLERVAPHLPKPPFLFCQIGPFNSGKTTRLAAMVAYYANKDGFREVDIVSPTARRDPVWLQCIAARDPNHVSIHVYEQVPWARLMEREKKCLEFYQPYTNKAMIGLYKLAEHERDKIWQINRHFDDPGNPYCDDEGKEHHRLPHFPRYARPKALMVDVAARSLPKAPPARKPTMSYSEALAEASKGFIKPHSNERLFQRELKDPRAEIQDMVLSVDDDPPKKLASMTALELATHTDDDKEFNKIGHLLILDDMVGMLQGDELARMNKLVSVQRHMQTATIFCAQKIKGGVGTFIRANRTHAAISNIANEMEMAAAKEAFGADVPHFEAAYEAAVFVTDENDPAQKYNFLYIDCTAKPPKLYRNFDQRILCEGYDPDFGEVASQGTIVTSHAGERKKPIALKRTRGRKRKADKQAVPPTHFSVAGPGVTAGGQSK